MYNSKTHGLTDVLDTLPRRELLAGYAEVVKYGLLGYPDFFSWLEEYGTAVLDGDNDARRHAIKPGPCGLPVAGRILDKPQPQPAATHQARVDNQHDCGLESVPCRSEVRGIP